jgi:hypothetical protein
MPSQPTNVRIITNDREVRAGTTQSSEYLLRLSSVTLTSDDLDRLALALADRLSGGVQKETSPKPDEEYVTVKRNAEQRPMSEF